MFSSIKLWAIGAVALALAALGSAAMIEIADLKTEAARLEASLATAAAQRDAAVTVNQENARVARQLEADLERQATATYAAIQARDAAQGRVQIVKQEVIRVIEKSPATCPVAASVTAVLDQLRGQPAAAGADPGDPGRAGPGQAPGGAPRLQPDAGSAARPANTG